MVELDVGGVIGVWKSESEYFIPVEKSLKSHSITRVKNKGFPHITKIVALIFECDFSHGTINSVGLMVLTGLSVFSICDVSQTFSHGTRQCGRLVRHNFLKLTDKS